MIEDGDMPQNHSVCVIYARNAPKKQAREEKIWQLDRHVKRRIPPSFGTDVPTMRRQRRRSVGNKGEKWKGTYQVDWDPIWLRTTSRNYELPLTNLTKPSALRGGPERRLRARTSDVGIRIGSLGRHSQAVQYRAFYPMKNHIFRRRSYWRSPLDDVGLSSKLHALWLRRSDCSWCGRRGLEKGAWLRLNCGFQLPHSAGSTNSWCYIRIHRIPNRDSQSKISPSSPTNINYFLTFSSLGRQKNREGCIFCEENPLKSRGCHQLYHPMYRTLAANTPPASGWHRKTVVSVNIVKHTFTRVRERHRVCFPSNTDQWSMVGPGRPTTTTTNIKKQDFTHKSRSKNLRRAN